MKKIILITLISISLCGIKMKRKINEIISEIPQIKENITKAEKNSTSKIKNILRKGIDYYAHLLTTIYNPGIMDEYIDDFISDIAMSYFKIDDKSIYESLKGTLELAKLNNPGDLIIPKIFFKNKKEGNFLIVLIEKNKDDTFDFLFLKITSDVLNKSPDNFILASNDAKNNWGTSDKTLKIKDGSLSREEYDNLFNFLQMSMFYQGKKILDAIHKQ
jgi:hypothetical protein